MRIDLNIPLKDKQAYMYNMLMSRRYREFLFYGASRSGKTFVICQVIASTKQLPFPPQYQMTVLKSSIVKKSLAPSE